MREKFIGKAAIQYNMLGAATLRVVCMRDHMFVKSEKELDLKFYTNISAGLQTPPSSEGRAESIKK